MTSPRTRRRAPLTVALATLLATGATAVGAPAANAATDSDTNAALDSSHCCVKAGQGSVPALVLKPVFTTVCQMRSGITAPSAKPAPSACTGTTRCRSLRPARRI